jgi:hypothetical protein
MMNSAFVAERARSLAQKLLQTDTANGERVNRAWFTVLGREPSAEEAAAGLEYVRRYPAKAVNDEARLAAWASLCRVLIGSNDFIYVH